MFFLAGWPWFSPCYRGTYDLFDLASGVWTKELFIWCYLLVIRPGVLVQSRCSKSTRGLMIFLRPADFTAGQFTTISWPSILRGCHCSCCAVPIASSRKWWAYATTGEFLSYEPSSIGPVPSKVTKAAAGFSLVKNWNRKVQMESYMSWDELGVSRWKELEALRLLQRSMPKARIKNDRLDLRLGESWSVVYANADT